MIDLQTIARRWQLPSPDAAGRVSLGARGYIASVNGRLAVVVTGDTPPQWLLPRECHVLFRSRQSGATIICPLGYASEVFRWLESREG